jgi:hypothetical protein
MHGLDTDKEPIQEYWIWGMNNCSHARWDCSLGAVVLASPVTHSSCTESSLFQLTSMHCAKQLHFWNEFRRLRLNSTWGVNHALTPKGYTWSYLAVTTHRMLVPVINHALKGLATRLAGELESPAGLQPPWEQGKVEGDPPHRLTNVLIYT